MTEPSTSRPPRLAPDRPFPPYAYTPGRHPHPTHDPGGHSYDAHRAITDPPDPPDPDHWRASGDYLYGIDLFNHGYYWEAHEAWEGLWVACGRRGATATYLQALINLAAAGFKANWGSERGLRANAATAAGLFKAFAGQRGSSNARFMGLDVAALTNFADQIAKTAPRGDATSDAGTPLPFDLLLRPE